MGRPGAGGPHGRGRAGGQKKEGYRHLGRTRRDRQQLCRQHSSHAGLQARGLNVYTKFDFQMVAIHFKNI